MNLRFPKPTEPIAGAGGLITRSWRDYLASLSAQTVSAELFAAIAALNQRIDGLSDGDWLSDDTLAYGQYSVQSLGTLKDGTVIFQLQGDVGEPGPSFYYGTDALGVKGWHVLSLANLADIDYTTPPTDGQVLTFDEALGKWVPADPSGGSGGLEVLLTDQLDDQLTDQLGEELTGSEFEFPWSQITGTPTTLAGYGITDAQPLDGDLTAIAALASTGYAKRTGADTWTLDSIIGLSPYTMGTLPSVTPAWRVIAVTDLAGTPAPCYSDGTNWRRFSDDTIAT